MYSTSVIGAFGSIVSKSMHWMITGSGWIGLQKWWIGPIVSPFRTRGAVTWTPKPREGCGAGASPWPRAGSAAAPASPTASMQVRIIEASPFLGLFPGSTRGPRTRPSPQRDTPSAVACQPRRHSLISVSVAQAAPRKLARRLAVPEDRHAVDDHVLDSDSQALRGFERRSIADRLSVEHDHVRETPRFQNAAVGEPRSRRRQRRHLAHSLLERKQAHLPGIAAEDAGEGAVRSRVRLVGRERTVERANSRIAADHDPRLAKGELEIVLAHRKIDRGGPQ